MDPKQLRRIAALIGAGALATGGAAIAATADPPPDLPEEARADEHVGSDTPDEADVEADVGADAEDGGVADADTQAHGDAHTEVAADPDANDHGQAVSTFAQETGLEGRERGEAVAELASSNRQDGEHTDQRAPTDEVTTTEASGDEGSDGADDAGDDAEGSRATGEEASAARDRDDR